MKELRLMHLYLHVILHNFNALISNQKLAFISMLFVFSELASYLAITTKLVADVTNRKFFGHRYVLERFKRIFFRETFSIQL